MDLAAVIMAVNEPQLERCLLSVHEQDEYCFSEIVYINNVIPEFEAHRRALERVKSDWGIWIGGDFILYPDAIQTVLNYMKSNPPDGRTSQYNFGLFDTFLHRIIGNCSVRYHPAFRLFPEEDILGNDMDVTLRLDNAGWNRFRPIAQGICLGTHFDQPDEFQIFRRFFCRGAKAKRTRGMKRGLYISRLKKRLKIENDPEIQLAIDSFNLGLKHGYRGSHDINYERQLYLQWKMGRLK